jgi:pimeloyl-ACP methyl ester carboxylesterase
MNSSYLFANDLRFHYLQWDSEEQQRPVLLLHGLASNARIWELVAPELVKLGWPAIALDARGHGLTDKPDGDYGFGTFQKDLLALIDALSLERPLLVGHSWGALIALDYAAQFPFGPRSPAGLVLVDGGVMQLDDAPGATWKETRERLTPPRLGGMPAEDFLARITTWTSEWGSDERIPQIVLGNFEIAEDETIWPHLTFERHMQIVRAMWEFKTYARMERLRCPALAVLAVPPRPRSEREEQFLALKESGVEHSQTAYPGLQVHWMQDSIHDIPLQYPAELADLIGTFASQVY